MARKSSEATKIYNDTYYRANQEEIRAKQRSYRIAHREQKAIYNKLYSASHRKELNANLRAWKAAHPGYSRAGEHRYRARKYSALCTATPDHEKAIKAAYKGRCAYCGEKPKKLTIDHVIPLSKRGSHTPENLVPACWPCNYMKRDHEAPVLPAIRLLC